MITKYKKKLGKWTVIKSKYDEDEEVTYQRKQLIRTYNWINCLLHNGWLKSDVYLS